LPIIDVIHVTATHKRTKVGGSLCDATRPEPGVMALFARDFVS
jgi:hypothetical protein